MRAFADYDRAPWTPGVPPRRDRGELRVDSRTKPSGRTLDRTGLAYTTIANFVLHFFAALLCMRLIQSNSVPSSSLQKLKTFFFAAQRRCSG